jgi:hypothetical protein
MRDAMNTPTTDIDPFEGMLRERLHRLADHAPTTVPLPNDVRVTAVEPRRGRRVAGIGATIALVAGGIGLTTVALQGAAEPGGADSPEAAVREFADALAAEDLLGMIDVTLPEEVTALRAAFDEMTAEAQRVGLLGAEFALDGVAGVDVTVDGLALTTRELGSDLVAVTSTDGVVGAAFDATAFPLGRLIDDPAVVRIDSASASVDLAGSDLTLVTMRRSGRWYVSFGMSIAEAIWHPATQPESMGLVAEGSATPEAAAETFYRRLAQLDVASATRLVAPGEGDVFRRYASLWLPPVQRELIGAQDEGLTIGLTDLQFERVVDADGRVTVRPVAFTISGTTPAGWADQPSGIVRVDEYPTLIDSYDGSGAWILEPGVVPPATVDGLGDPLPYESDAVQQLYRDGAYNSTWADPDGSIQPFDDPNPAPAVPQPFRIERRDGCTTASGTPFSDVLAYTPGFERLDDATVRSCGDGDPSGALTGLFLFVGGRGFTNLPPVTLVEDGGEWFVSPIGTIAAQALETMRSLPDDANIVDVPILPYWAGAMARADLDRTLQYTASDDVPAACRAIAEPDGSGGLRTVADPALADVRACAAALGYSSGLGSTEVTVDSGSETSGWSAVPPATDTATGTATDTATGSTSGFETGVPASTAPATP